MAKSKADNGVEIAAASNGTAATVATVAGAVHLRSRYASYRVRDVQFNAHVAVVTPEVFAQISGLPQFGDDKDFWVDATR